MRTPTLFSAYRRVLDRQEEVLLRRPGGHYGVRVGDDKMAVRWRRLDRLRSKLEESIKWRIGDEHARYYCRSCGLPSLEFHEKGCKVDTWTKGLQAGGERVLEIDS